MIRPLRRAHALATAGLALLAGAILVAALVLRVPWPGAPGAATLPLP